MKGKAVIAGVGHTAYGKHPGRNSVGLLTEAVANALADARIDKSLVDGVMVKVPSSGGTGILYGQKVAEALGIRPRVGYAMDQGGAANISLIANAVMSIEAGMLDIAVIGYGDTPRTGSRAVYHRPRGDDAIYGWFSTAAGYALVHRAYSELYQVRPEHFGAVAVTVRKHGAANPDAQLRKAISLDDYMAAPWVVEPLRRDDCCLVSDGAAAVVVMSAERARQLDVPAPVPILGFGQAHESWDVQYRPDLTKSLAHVSAQSAFKMAGLTPAQIDVAQIYDCFTVTALLTLEEYGFCKPGHAGAFCAEGGIALGGALPMNTSGGLLSETGTPGMPLVIEGVRQMRGAANLQVPNARTCVVSNQGGTLHTHATLILGAA